jgi:hypothetical protein
MLACNVHKPEYTANFALSYMGAREFGVLSPVVYSARPETTIIWENTFDEGQTPQSCASDPIVQAAVAKLATGKFSKNPPIPLSGHISCALTLS